jgi:hypothetical protein
MNTNQLGDYLYTINKYNEGYLKFEKARTLFNELVNHYNNIEIFLHMDFFEEDENLILKAVHNQQEILKQLIDQRNLCQDLYNYVFKLLVHLKEYDNLITMEELPNYDFFF